MTAGKNILILVFLTGGQAQLEEDGEVVWSSDDDTDFLTEHGNEFLDPDKDAAAILEYLVDEGLVDEEEAGDVEIEVDSLDPDSESDDEDEEEESDA